MNTAANTTVTATTAQAGSYKDLLAQQATLAAQIEVARKAELTDAVSKVRALVAEYNLTADDVFPPAKAGKSGAAKTAGIKVAAKYRDPATGAEWTGRGKEPTWIKGQDRAQFLIQAEVADA